MNFDQGIPDGWPPAPLLAHWLLENPWPLGLCLLAVAAGLVLVSRRQQRKGLLIGGGVVGLLAVGVIGVASAIETSREAISRGTRRLVDAAVVPIHLDVFGETLSRDVRLYDRGYEEILDTLRRSTARWRVGQAWITSLAAQQSGKDRGKTYFAVITRLDTSLGGGSSKSRWIFHWRRESDGVWRVEEIEWLTLNGRDAGARDLP